MYSSTQFYNNACRPNAKYFVKLYIIVLFMLLILYIKIMKTSQTHQLQLNML